MTENQGRPPHSWEWRQASNRRRLLSVLLLLALLGAALILRTHDPMQAREWIACPAWAWLGIHCPGCGATRAAHHLLNARLLLAAQNNALLLLLGVPCIVFFVVRELLLVATGSLLLVAPPVWIARGIVVALLIFVILRNIPIENLDAIRPVETSVSQLTSQAGPPCLACSREAWSFSCRNECK